MPDRPTAIVADKSEAFLMYMSILLNRMDFEVLPVSNGNSLLVITSYSIHYTKLYE